MPAPGQTPDQSNLKTLIHTEFSGLNLSDSAMAIADAEFVALQNIMPFANGNLAVFPGPLAIWQPSGQDIHNIWCLVQGGTPYVLYQLTNGDLYALTLTGKPAPIYATLYGSKTASVTLSTANELITSDSSIPNESTAITAVATDDTYGELPSQGTASLWPNHGTEPSPSGKGYLWDTTALEGKTVEPQTWKPSIGVQLKTASGSTSATFVFYFRVYKRSSGGSYTLIVEGDTNPTVVTSASPTVLNTWNNMYTVTGTDFSTGDKLYVDIIGFYFSGLGGTTNTAIEYSSSVPFSTGPFTYISSSSVALIASGTTIDGLHFTKWQTADAASNPEAILFTDTTLGYGSWDGSSWTILDDTLTGQAIAVFQGRVWIAVDYVITYSAPDVYTDFTTVDYGGTFLVTEPSMNAAPIALQASQNWLYIAGNSLMALNNVQITTVAGVTATTFFVTLVSSSVGIQTEKACFVYNNTLLLSTNIGIYAYYGLVGQRITQNVGDNFSGSYYLSVTNVMGKTILFSNQGFCMMIDEGKWFNVSYTAPFVSPWIQQDTLVFDGLTGYVTDGAGIYEFGGDVQTAQDVYIHTKLYDASNASLNKQVVKFGFEYFQNELFQPQLTNVIVDVSYRADGFISSSNDFIHNNLSGTANTFVRDTINLIDRYFSTALTMNATPGTSISGFYWQFQDSTSWP